MTDYDQAELQRMIQQYQTELMSLYPSSTSDNSYAQSEPAASEPIETAEAAIPNDETDIGSLQVRVSTENRAVPLVGAVVTVTHNKDADQPVLVRTMITDSSGLTPLIDLATKERALSLSPGNDQPFSTYTIRVTADGYYPKEFRNVPVYGGVTAVQSVSMIPLSEGGDGDAVLIYPQGAPSIT